MNSLGRLLPMLVAMGLALAACEDTPPLPPPEVAAPSPAGLAHGLDMPTDARDVTMELKSSRPDFVARYYRDPASHWPALSAAEVRMLSSEGIKTVAVWESHSHRPDYFSYAAGYYDAMAAYRQAGNVGQPAGSAIYFAVDFNARDGDIAGPVDQYFRGIAAGFAAAAGHRPEYRVGVYGSGAVCAYLKRMRLAQYAWLSNATAWSGYGSFADWDIRQGGRSPSLSFSQDANEARGDYGGFQLASQYTSL